MEDLTKESAAEIIPVELYNELKSRINELTIEMIPNGIFKEIATEIGISNMIKLSEIVGGTTFYIPKADTFIRPIRDIKIKEEFNGYNYSELAIKYSLTDRRIRTICGKGNLKGQMNIADYLDMK